MWKSKDKIKMNAQRAKISNNLKCTLVRFIKCYEWVIQLCVRVVVVTLVFFSAHLSVLNATQACIVLPFINSHVEASSLYLFVAYFCIFHVYLVLIRKHKLCETQHFARQLNGAEWARTMEKTERPLSLIVFSNLLYCYVRCRWILQFGFFCLLLLFSLLLFVQLSRSCSRSYWLAMLFSHFAVNKVCACVFFHFFSFRYMPGSFLLFRY